jgi:hypothetical protein
MKLRIRGNSLRLRLTQSEVKKIAQGAAVKEAIHFLNGVELHYILAPEEKSSIVNAQFIDHQIIVGLPKEMAKKWATSSQISIKHEENKFSILIEKDFMCLKERQNEKEDESDMFENPNEPIGHCE